MEHIYTKDICDTWKNNPLYNPFKPNQKIKITKTGIYAKLEKKCKKFENNENFKKKVSRKEPTDEDCLKFRKDPTINPITKRKLDINAINGVYAKLMKKCKENKNDIIRARNIIINALKPVLNRMDTIENRIKFAKIVEKYTMNIESCLTKSTTTKNTLALIEKTNTGMIKDIIHYDKRIGSASEYGIAYGNVGQKLFKLLSFSSKILEVKNSTLEILLLLKMSDLVQNKKTPHMPIIYKVVRCDKPFRDIMNEEGIAKYEEPHRLISDGKYYIIINELATYDLANFLKEAHTDNEYESVIMQIYISLHTFHKYTGYLHNDAHWGNFLIHKIKAGGYWHYKINNVDMYVPNLGYLVVLWDPGLARMITERKYAPIVDFNRIYQLIVNTGLFKNERVKEISPEVLEPFTSMYYLMEDEKDKRNAFVHFFKNNKKVHGFKTILIDPSEKPKGIINSEPYLL